MAYNKFIQDAYKTYPPLKTYEEEQELVHRYKDNGDDEGWMAELVARNICLANRMIISMTKPSQDALREDLLTVAIEALWKAVRNWDPDFGTRFSTYAGSAIRNGLIREMFVYRDTNSRTFSMNTEVRNHKNGDEMDNEAMDSLIRPKITADTKITFENDFTQLEDRDFQETMFKIIMHIKTRYSKIQQEKMDFAAKVIFDNSGNGIGHIEMWDRLYPKRKLTRQRIDQIYNEGKDLIRKGLIRLSHSGSVGGNGICHEWRPFLDRLRKYNVDIFSLNPKYSHDFSAISRKFHSTMIS